VVKVVWRKPHRIRGGNREFYVRWVSKILYSKQELDLLRACTAKPRETSRPDTLTDTYATGTLIAIVRISARCGIKIRELQNLIIASKFIHYVAHKALNGRGYLLSDVLPSLRRMLKLYNRVCYQLPTC